MNTKSSNKLPKTYYEQEDVVAIARDLIGKKIISNIDGKITSGIITETEAYRHYDDKACHSHLGKFTKRTKIMYESGGLAYVYLCYGIHNLFNIVTNDKEKADAVLIRAAQPLDGIDLMLERRNKEKLDKTLSSGPGNFSKAFGLNKQHYGEDLTGKLVWIEDDEALRFRESEITASKRIGIDYAGEDKHLPWRFYLNTSDYISKR